MVEIVKGLAILDRELGVVRQHSAPPMLGLSTMVNELGIIIRVIDPTDRTGSEVIMNHYFGLGH